MSVHKTFYEEVHRRASKEARRVLHIDAGGSIMVVVLLFLIYVLAVWHFVGATAATSDIEDRLLATVAPVILAALVYWQRRRSAASEIHGELELERDTLKQDLAAVALSGQLAYLNMGVDLETAQQPDQNPNLANLRGVSFFFQNLSDKLLTYRLGVVEVWVGNNKQTLDVKGEAPGFIHQGQPLSYSVPLRVPAPVTPPFSVTVNLSLHYDNVPAIMDRGTRRKVKLHFRSLVVGEASSTILEAEEWPLTGPPAG